jgi:hypothetical protein
VILLGSMYLASSTEDISSVSLTLACALVPRNV